MAPRIQIPANDTFKTLYNVLNNRLNTNQILKEREKAAYTTTDYQHKRAELNRTKFL
jgi:hypothetical protein